MKGGLPACGAAGPSSICRHPPQHMHTLTLDLCIYALQRHRSKEYGWKGVGGEKRGRRLFGLQTESDGVLAGVRVAGWRLVQR